MWCGIAQQAIRLRAPSGALLDTDEGSVATMLLEELDIQEFRDPDGLLRLAVFGSSTF